MNAKKFNFDLADSETMQLLKHYTLYLPFLQRKTTWSEHICIKQFFKNHITLFFNNEGGKNK